MEKTKKARVLLKSVNHGTLTLLTRHYNEFFPMSQNLPFVLSTEGEVLFFLDNLEIKNRGIKDYNRAGLYASKGLEAVEIMGRLNPLSTSDLRYARMTAQFFMIHPEMEELKDSSNYIFYTLKNDFIRYFTNPKEFQSLSFEGIKVNPPISQIELSSLAQSYSEFNISCIDSDGFFQKEGSAVKYTPFTADISSVDEISHEMSRLFN